jgi:hypothetical protein
MRIIAYGIIVDYTDEYLPIGEDTSIKFVCLFAKTMIRVFGENYLRAPNEEDTKRLMTMNEARGVQGCLEVSIVCTRGGRNARQHDTVSALAITMIQSLCLKLWPRCMLSLGSQDL